MRITERWEYLVIEDIPEGQLESLKESYAELGYDERTIADMLGQKTVEMARHYARRADRSRKMTTVVEKFDAEVNRRRTASVKPTPEKCQADDNDG